MSIKNPYLQKVYQQVCQRDANEPEFLNAVMEVLSTLEPVIEKHPEYEAAGLIERLVEPERAVQFRVAWQAKPRLTVHFAFSLIPRSAHTKAVCAFIQA